MRRDIERIAQLDPDLARSGLAAVALAMAREIDDPDSSTTSKSMCAGQLRDALDRLRELTPAAEEGDHVDDLSTRRASRLARIAAAPS